jgi:hypothetical protein
MFSALPAPSKLVFTPGAEYTQEHIRQTSLNKSRTKEQADYQSKTRRTSSQEPPRTHPRTNPKHQAEALFKRGTKSRLGIPK